MTHIVSLGDVMVDVVARLPGPLAAGSDTPATITFHGGGAAANLAAWAVAAGASATFLGRVGDDAFGRRAVSELEAAGVDVRAAVDAGRPTGTCIVLVDPAGQRTMVPSAGANDAPSDVNLLPDVADWLCVSGYALLRAGSRAAAAAALAVARERGWAIAVDAASSAPLTAAGPAQFLDLLGEDVLLLANEDEVHALTGLTSPEQATRVLAQRLGQAVIKRGAAGAVWSDGVEVHSVPAPATTVIDTTGAGDAFAAGFLAMSGAGPDRLTAAVELGASAVASVGGRPPTRR